jgi:hypothetical protein
VEWFDVAEFWSKVAVAKSWQCWEWKGRKNENGYGVVWGQKAHRVAYTIAKGSIPANLLVLHGCDNRACCNPNHLRTGTYADNAADMMARGRHWCARGERNGRARLTDEQVSRILKGAETGVALAAALGVAESTISMIRTGRRRSLVH